MNDARVCVSVCAETTSELAGKIEKAAVFADIIEIRFDCLPPHELRAEEGSNNAVNSIIRKFPGVKFLITLRSHSEGGRRMISEEERKSFWNSGFTAEMVDFEGDIGESSFDSTWNSKIVSLHLVSTKDIPDSLESAAADMLKLACPVSDCVDALDIWKFLARSASPNPVPVIPIAMGEAGKWTRIMGPAFGSPLAYASLNDESGTAAGQIPAADMLDVYRVKELDRTTEIYGLVGNPVSHSVSPFMHNAAFREQKVNAVYIPFEVTDLHGFFARMVRPDTSEIDWRFRGLSVTIPFKQSIMAELDFVDQTAEAIGAVNTVQLIDKQLVGFNTDAEGFIEPLKSSFGSIEKIKVAVIGAGGAARACLYALLKERAIPTVFARNPNSASRLAEEFGCGIELLTSEYSLLDSYVIAVNATPAGTAGDLQNTTPISMNQMKNLQLVYDLVYNPYETLFLSEAAKAGVPAISGIEMLIAQASRQYEIWTGRKAPRPVMGRAALSRLT